MRVENVDFNQAHQTWRFAADKAPTAVALDPQTKVLFEPGGFTAR